MCVREFCSDLRIRTLVKIDDRIGPNSDKRDAVLRLWGRVATTSSITSKEIGRDDHVSDIEE